MSIFAMRLLPAVVAGAATFATLATVAAAQELPPPREVQIERITHRGTGCRQGTVAQSISGDGQAFTLLFSDYLVDTSARDGRPARRACDVDVDMRVPAGWSFTVYALFVRGYAALDAGVIGVQKASSSFGAMRPQEVGRIRLEGPYDGDYQLSSDLPLNEVEWSRCGPERTRRFNLKTAITVRPKRGFSDGQGDVDDPSLGHGLPRGLLTIDSLDGAVAQEYRVAWRRCPGGGGGGGGGGNPQTATCSLTVGQANAGRTFTESKSAPNQQRAKQLATERVVQTCQAALQNRPALRLQCRGERAVCSFSR